MKRLIPLLVTVTLALVLSGCATQKTSAGRKTNVLGGLAKVDSGSYQAATPTEINVDTDQLFGRSNPSGTKVSLLWGLFSFTDN